MPLPEPVFIQRNAQQIIDEMVADYQARVGRQLNPAQVERLIINALAYRELLLRNQVQEAAKQNLLSFATAPMIDYLGELLGVYRLPASAAQTTIQFTLVSGHGAISIPAGIRIGSTDGRAIFQTRAIINVDALTDVVTVLADCQVKGTVGNGYATGIVTDILDPQAYLAAATNITITGGGSDEESDDELRERIKLAPSAFSTAGSKGAYKFHAKSAHPAIVDVEVLGPNDDPGINPGEVYIYPLVQGGISTPTEVLDAVLQACTAEKVRPLTDTVLAQSPTRVDYVIEVVLTLYDGSDQPSVVATVTAQLQAYVDAKKNRLGQDVVRAQIIERSALLGQVYNVNVVSPTTDLIIDSSEFSNCTGIDVTVSGFNHG